LHIGKKIIGMTLLVKGYIYIYIYMQLEKIKKKKTKNKNVSCVGFMFRIFC